MDRPDAAPDEVDRIVDAWEAERPDLDVEPLRIFSRVHRLARHLDRARRRAFEAHDLELWEFDVLSALRRAGAPYELTPGRLIAETLVSSGTMTNRIDRMSARRLVARRSSDDDRRIVLVSLTSDGKERVDAAMAGLLDRERALLAGLSAGERDSLAEMLRAVLRPFDAPAATRPEGHPS
ncbi:transcriptional regulator, MarR family [Beutenbergia cavernae DSM 12333]|uniref:Transcriptional regulator, MarR family n=1 Tax=Beutenbergia cavernae (strain ATCC BAA-8 / DSM 12333 / CCUG 43141 / JCM 11478 / NBRC 16432 / NCIMB 13614 / HKI 0122) TaxID=471853 RepID=C5C055_BEUC1|nr:MarR family transcriptional regulator [Beutenbergia cavernae]ACQ79241.1 transcriptional regulator, MarR family [Beutenbergia cavernae DSM 12333]